MSSFLQSLLRGRNDSYVVMEMLPPAMCGWLVSSWNVASETE